jgi:hypothetical protein
MPGGYYEEGWKYVWSERGDVYLSLDMEVKESGSM